MSQKKEQMNTTQTKEDKTQGKQDKRKQNLFKWR